MEALALLDRAHAAGLVVSVDGDMLVIRGPRSAEALARDLLEHKVEILSLLCQPEKPVGDGQPPPLDRPPSTEQELRRLIDHLADPVAFAAWLEWTMNRTDPAEGQER